MPNRNLLKQILEATRDVWDRPGTRPSVGKKATFIIATGGIYDAQTQMASFNFVEPYLRSVFAFIGVTNATFITAGGTSALNQGHDRDAFLAPYLQAVRLTANSQFDASSMRAK